MELLVNSFKQKVSYFFNVLERLTNFKVYNLDGVLPDYLRGSNTIKFFALVLVYSLCFYTINMELRFLEPNVDVKLLYNFWGFCLASIWLSSFVIGYTPLTMTFNVFYSLFSVLIVGSKLFFIGSWEALAQSSVSAYFVFMYFSLAVAPAIYYKVQQNADKN